MANSEKRLGVLRTTAKEIASHKIRMRILKAALIMLCALVSVLYVSSALYKQTGSFTVSINKFEMTRYGLSLSESRDMSYATSNLNAKIVESITNIAEEEIDKNVDKIDGTHNGKNYIAYTFYAQNAGEVEVSYEYEIRISNISNDLDEAIRIKLYVDGVPTTYAKTASDGSGAEPGTVEFYSATIAAKGRIDSFKPDDMTKYTVVVWIEGNDPDCLDWLIGGQIRLEMDLAISH